MVTALLNDIVSQYLEVYPPKQVEEDDEELGLLILTYMEEKTDVARVMDGAQLTMANIKE